MATLGPRDGLRSATNAIRKAAAEANRIVQATIDDVERTTEQALPRTVLIGGGAVLAITGLSTTLAGLGLSLSGQRAWGPLLIGASLILAGGACLLGSGSPLPGQPFGRARRELRQALSATADALR